MQTFFRTPGKMPSRTPMLPTLADIQPAELRRNGATLSLARRAMEPHMTTSTGHLLYSVLTRPSGANARRLKSRHPFVTAAQHLISLSDNNIRAAQWADYQWNAEWTDSPTRLRIFIPGTHPEWPSQEEPGSSSKPMSDVSALACTNGIWPPLRPVSVAQKNKPSTMLSSNFQSIDLSMDWMAWRCWTMRQLNGCSTSTPRSSAAKQWFQQLV